MEEVSSNKRLREGSDESPEEKRLRADLFLDIFEDESDDGEEEGLASVMRSLEEEISLPLPATAPSPAMEEVPLDSDSHQQPDLGYLFEASDDELGLPPTLPITSSEGCFEVEAVSSEVDAGFGRIWGFSDEMPGCYDGLDFTDLRPEERGSDVGEDASLFDGVLFDYSDVVSAPAGFAEISWRPDSLPAV